MHKRSKACLEPQPEDALWRYMDMTRFVALLETGCLFFCRADKFDDAFEGALSQVNVDQREAVGPINPRMGVIHVPFREMPPLTAINCWSAGRHESAAMWSLYCPGGTGVAVRTSFSSLSESFEACARWDVAISKVTYMNYESEAIPDTHLLAPFLHKRQSFEHERGPSFDSAYARPDSFGDTESVPRGRNHVPVVLDKLVQAIFVSPTAPGWYAELVRQVAKRYRVAAAVKQSSLVGDPIF